MFIPNYATAIVVVQSEKRRRGDETRPSARQLRRIDRVVAADRKGKVTRADIVTRLHQIAAGR